MTDTHYDLCMVGLGYIGLPTAALFADNGVKVIGLDVSSRVVDGVNAGRVDIVEPGLDQIVARTVASGQLSATLKPVPADTFLIAVPTPISDDKQPDLSYIQAAARAIAPVLRPGNLVVLESTSPVGTTEKLAAWLAAARPDLTFPADAGEEADVHLAYCPERILPGKALIELVDNDRIIGGMTTRATELAQAVYGHVVKGACIATNAQTAEMCKLVENSSRDVAIAFANELSILCDKLNINVWDLIALANRHPRVNILQPGAGVGGHCIAVDPWFIVSSAPEEAQLIKLARERNDGKPHWVISKVGAAAEGHANPAPRIACLGVAFKPDIDDLRESPALEIATALAGLHADVMVVEPHITELPEGLAGRGVILIDLDGALAQADIVVCLVRHAAFQDLAGRLGAQHTVIDAVGLTN
ncbi:UDP-N-acetyl-D-mannosamine dehydrogenase [Loktanella sp. R86503]|uniref:UDP-N-acetyl-D-mannosamine dehydrogenase n=1 Tax=Loktanella sp. R86503 TaxID=3093847 RepID=UPI0036D96427